MTQVVVIYITFPDKASALAIGRILVQEKLVACVNILPHMHAVYVWEGTLEEAEEVVMIAKAAEEKTVSIIARVKALHSYSCPCITVLPVVAGNPEFLAWVRQE